MVTRLQGPITASHWEVFDKDIWLFGDVHEIRRGCKGRKYKDLAKVIEEEAKILQATSPEKPKIEIFTENPFDDSKLAPEDYSYLPRIGYALRKFTEEECHVKHHRGDRRFNNSLLKDLADISALFFSDGHGLTQRKKDGKLMDANDFTKPYDVSNPWGIDSEELIDHFVAPAIDECQKMGKMTIGKWLDNLFAELKINKQNDKIEDEDIKTQIKRYFSMENEVYNPWGTEKKKMRRMRFTSVAKALKKIRDGGILSSDEHLFLAGMLFVSCLFMDAYLIARVFGPSIGKRVIIFVGDWHRASYAKFFKQVGGKRLLKKSRRSAHQCVTLPERLFS